MIIDHIENLNFYNKLHPDFDTVFNYITNNDIAALPLGKHKIDEDKLFIILDKGNGRSKHESMPEIHRKYIDIQIVLDGIDEMGWLPKSSCTVPAGEYNESTDIQFFKNKPLTWIKVKSGMFVIFFPNDGHQPLIGNSQIHKAVIKVAV